MTFARRLPTCVLHVLANASGGAALSTVELINGLRDRGISSAVVCGPAGTAEDLERVTTCVDGRVVWLPLHNWNRVRTAAARWRQMKRGVRTGWGHLTARRVAGFAQQHGANLIHTSTLLSPEGGLAARRLGLPHVWHVRELVGPDGWFALPRRGVRLSRFLQARASVVVANSQAAAAALGVALDEGRLQVVPNGVPLHAPATRQWTPGTPVRVAMIGHLASEAKQHAMFVEAAARVDARMPVEFRIYGAIPAPVSGGDGASYVDRLRHLVRARGLEDRLTFRGHVTPPHAIMEDIDVLVHPSGVESFGRIVIEAMAAGRPVIGVRGGGVATLIHDGVTGRLVPAGDVPAMAAAIDALVADPVERVTMGARARALAVDEYSLDRHVARMVEVYTHAAQFPVGRR